MNKASVSECPRFGLSTFWCVDVWSCRRLSLSKFRCRSFGLSTFQFVDVSLCQHFGLSMFRFVDGSVCRCLTLHGFVAIKKISVVSTKCLKLSSAASMPTNLWVGDEHRVTFCPVMLIFMVVVAFNSLLTTNYYQDCFHKNCDWNQFH